MRLHVFKPCFGLLPGVYNDVEIFGPYLHIAHSGGMDWDVDLIADSQDVFVEMTPEEQTMARIFLILDDWRWREECRALYYLASLYEAFYTDALPGRVELKRLSVVVHVENVEAEYKKFKESRAYETVADVVFHTTKV